MANTPPSTSYAGSAPPVGSSFSANDAVMSSTGLQLGAGRRGVSFARTPSSSSSSFGYGTGIDPQAADSTSGKAGTPATSTGLSARLWKVTSGSLGLDDREAREALKLVSDDYAGPSTHSPHAKKSPYSTKTPKLKRNHRQKNVGGATTSANVTNGSIDGKDSAASRKADDSRGDDEEEDGYSSPVFSSSEDESDGGYSQSNDYSSENRTTPWFPDSRGTERSARSRRSVLDRSSSPKASGTAHPSVARARIEMVEKARKNLKKDVEGRLVETSLRFLDAFGKVDDQLEALRSHLLAMKARCDEIQTQLDHTDQGTKTLLQMADGLREQKESTLIRSRLSTLFLSRFTLNPDEVATLTSREIEVGRDLFDAMDKVNRIRDDCRSLFAFVGEERKTSVGPTEGEGIEGRDPALAAKEIMSATSDQLDAGYDKVFRWCQFEFRKYTREAQLEVSAIMQEAIKRLMNRPQMLEEALQVLTNTRQSSILQSFLDALIKGGAGGLPRPIELHAHDPTRYIGDMLAWCHQTTAGEREFLDALFDIRTQPNRNVGEARDVTSESKEEILGRQCLDKNLEGLGKPLKLRVQQTVTSQEDIILGYKIANLVQFYLVTMQRTIGPEASLSKSLQELYDIALRAFSNALEAQGRSLLRFLHPPDANLAAPIALRDSAHVLQEVMAVFETSLTEEKDREAEFASILDTAIDPALEMCRRMIDLLPKAGQWERNVFLTNCGMYMIHILQPFGFAQKRKQDLQAQVDEWTEAMIEEHYERMREQTGLTPLLDAMASRSADTRLSDMPGADAKPLGRAITALDQFLASLDVHTSPRLALLSTPYLATAIHRSALERIAQDYSRLYAAVHDKANGYEFPSTQMPRSPDQVATLMGLEA